MVWAWRSVTLGVLAAMLTACSPAKTPAPPAAPPKAAAPAPAPAPPPGTLALDTMHAWSIYDDKEARTYKLADVTLKANSFKGGYGLAVDITAPGMAPYRLRDNEVYATLRFGMGRIDPAQPRQISLMLYTGGAHCCTRWIVLTPKAGKWSAQELGEWDGEGFDWPKDVDGDGAPDIVLFDQAFLYAFGGYAQSRPPPQIYHLTGGAFADVSAKPGFRPLFEKAMAEAEPDCRKADQSACAAYMANALRLGRGDKAWAVVRTAVPKGEPEWLPTGCSVKRQPDGLCPDGKEITYPDFPTALAIFLKDHGYGS